MNPWAITNIDVNGAISQQGQEYIDNLISWTLENNHPAWIWFMQITDENNVLDANWIRYLSFLGIKITSYSMFGTSSIAYVGA